MISLLHLNKLIKFIIFFITPILCSTFSIAAVDIWEKKENKKEITNDTNLEEEVTIESPILSDDINKIKIKIDEQKLDDFDQTVIGIFDPEDNNFNLDMWLKSDGEDIKKTLQKP